MRESRKFFEIFNAKINTLMQFVNNFLLKSLLGSGSDLPGQIFLLGWGVEK